MSVYTFARETNNKYCSIIESNGQVVYVGIIDNIPYEYYNREIASSRYFDLIAGDIIWLK